MAFNVVFVSLEQLHNNTFPIIDIHSIKSLERCWITLRKLHIVPAVVEFEFFGVMNITAPKQIIWNSAPTYKPYRIAVANRLSCGISNASMLLYAINSITFTIRRKQDISYAIRNAAIFRDLCRFEYFFVFVFDCWASILSFNLLVNSETRKNNSNQFSERYFLLNTDLKHFHYLNFILLSLI